MRPFKQVDVFTAEPYCGNPVAVVMDGSSLSTEDMQRFAHWTNLSETTFLLPPTDPAADYQVRIFTTAIELPFAGHPTIGTCHAWLEAGGEPQRADRIVQQCGIGLVNLRRTGSRLAFAAPPLIKGGPVTESELSDVCKVLGLEREAIVDAQWADNGPGWIAVRLASADEVLALTPDFSAVESYDIGVVGPHPIGVVGSHAPNKVGVVGARTPTDPGAGEPSIEVRAFFRSNGAASEDPVTGSLNAALAQWLLGDGTLEAPYVAAQGTALGRQGRVYVDEADEQIWIGGDAITCIDGSVFG